MWQAALKALQDVMDLAGVSLGDHAGAVFDIMVAKGSTAKDSGGEEWMRCGRRIMRVSQIEERRQAGRCDRREDTSNMMTFVLSDDTWLS